MEPLITIRDFRRAARARLPRMAWDYFRSGADAQVTLRANRRAYRRWELWPRVLVDVSERDLRTTVAGTPVDFPILVAPTGYHKLAHLEGELATARAAARLGTVFTLSTLATTSIEDVAREVDGPRWFQLYVHKDRGLTRSLVERAQESGYRALMLTVDTPFLGRRLADERNRFALPVGLEMANLTAGALAAGAGEGSALLRYVATRHDPTVTWQDLEWLRKLARLPILLKGILRADDAARAVDVGAGGIIVSNHGGRQLDGVPATLDALPEIVDAVRGRAEVLLDGGIRWGTDVLKALALGARAVMIGRPVLWGLAVGGEAGVEQVLTLLRDELSRAMALAGCRTLADIKRDLLRPHK